MAETQSWQEKHMIWISNTMKMFIKYLWILLAVGIIFLTYGCGQVPVVDKIIEQEETKHAVEDQQTGGAPHFQGIADALGCVFAPQSCKK
jgi:tetrahydromethanopterin S-methyltransferase subunit D